MTLQAIPVRVERGVVSAVDGSALPERANALLVIMPTSAEAEDLAEWQRAFDAFFEVVGRHQASKDLEKIGDSELNQLVHAARQDR